MTATDRLTLIAELRQKIDAVVRPLLAGVERYALLDFPNYPNVGDTAIWLGQVAYLKTVPAARCCFVSDHGTHASEAMRRRLGKGAILISGGGNLGDLWLNHQRFREKIIQRFPDNPIIQLPQSIHFDKPENLAKTRAIFNAHPNLTLLVRDARSLELAGNEFRGRSALCPDMAFCLGPLPRPRRPARRVLWLCRTDKESARPGDLPGDVARADWLEDDPTALLRLNTWATHHLEPALDDALAAASAHVDLRPACPATAAARL